MTEYQVAILDAANTVVGIVATVGVLVAIVAGIVLVRAVW